jgi:hypothetical protein
MRRRWGEWFPFGFLLVGHGRQAGHDVAICLWQGVVSRAPKRGRNKCCEVQASPNGSAMVIASLGWSQCILSFGDLFYRARICARAVQCLQRPATDLAVDRVSKKGAEVLVYKQSRVAACGGSYESGNRIQNKENWCLRASKAVMGGRKHLLHVIRFKEYKDYKN